MPTTTEHRGVQSLATAGAILMNVNFHLANGSPHPWLIPKEGFDEGVDMDSPAAADPSRVPSRLDQAVREIARRAHGSRREALSALRPVARLHRISTTAARRLHRARGHSNSNKPTERSSS